MGTIGILKRYIYSIFPMVNEELKSWEKFILSCPQSIPSTQALSSLEYKSFHAIGGSVYALYPGADTAALVKLIVAFQTISDYLDNLCDRAGVQDEEAFFSLHTSMIDALEPGGRMHDYYRHYPYKDDGGYLCGLVDECRSQINKLPSFNIVKGDVYESIRLYSELQAYKHLSNHVREEKLMHWSDLHIGEFTGILPWEFWAAAGSTLGIFMMFAAACSQDLNYDEVSKIKKAYFPWICGLHILLDYFIDYNEDIENNDLNFVRYYKDDEQVLNRFNLFIESSLYMAGDLHYPVFHTTVVLGLLAMYLSDDKAYSSNLKSITESIIGGHGIKLMLMHKLCTKLRNMKMI